MMDRNYGILASVDWNSNKWQALSSVEDIKYSNFGFVVENGFTFTSLNFGHEVFPCDDYGYYHGLLPQLWTRMPDKEKARYIKIVFIKSKNWHDKQNYIIGFYAFPSFQLVNKPSPIPEFKNGLTVNVKSLPKDIHLLSSYINLNTHPDFKKFLPMGKELGKQGYNYLTKDNVFKILDTMSILNPEDKKLSGIKYRLINSIGDGK